MPAAPGILLIRMWLSGLGYAPPAAWRPAPGNHQSPLTVSLRLQLSRERPVERCPECGSVYKMNYVGPEDDGHGHGHSHGDHGHGYEPGLEEPKSFADYVKPKYW